MEVVSKLQTNANNQLHANITANETSEQPSPLSSPRSYASPRDANDEQVKAVYTMEDVEKYKIRRDIRGDN